MVEGMAVSCAVWAGTAAEGRWSGMWGQRCRTRSSDRQARENGEDRRGGALREPLKGSLGNLESHSRKQAKLARKRSTRSYVRGSASAELLKEGKK
jgi:hypothetical protein